ncbi:MAG TPA: response regulator transcription factor [Thermodesulfobacteriota bacterium]|nr:response regulator transcription factor [Thermodesulfobacteriota bacterium]
MKKTFSIVIAEDHTILREALKALLSSHPDLRVVGEAADGLEAIRCAQVHTPDLVLIDLSMPRMNGLQAIKEIKSLAPQTKVVVLTVHKAEQYVRSALEAGADGYLLKEDGSTEFLIAIRHILDGRRYLSSRISCTIIDGFLQVEKAANGLSPCETLTERETLILKMVAEGHSSKEIAEFLCISLKTVINHRTKLMAKLNVHSVASLTVLAFEKGIIKQ